VLRAVFEVGYIHGDISPNNILLVEREREATRCKCSEFHQDVWVSKENPSRELVPVLMDFEYALPIDDRSERHDGRTGTVEFMALEVSNNKWGPLWIGLTIPKRLQFPTSIHSAAKLPARSPPSTQAAFHQHMFHDIESYTWMVIWAFFKCAKTLGLSKDMQLAYGRLLHPGTQRGAWDASVYLRQELECLPPKFEQLSDWFMFWIDELHEAKQTAYKAAFPEMLPSVLSKHALEAVDKSQFAISGLLYAVLEDPQLMDQALDIE